LKLYAYYRSSAAYRIRIALNLKGLDYEYVPVNLLERAQKSAAYLAQNPQGLVPALELADGTVLQQSMAILEYLEDSYPTPPLLPSAPVARARVRSLAQHIACDVHPLNNMSVLNYLREDLGVDQNGIGTWYATWVQRGFAALESQLSGTTGDYCHGDQPGLADVMLVPQMYNARRFEVPISGYPTLLRISDALEALPAFARAHPDRAPDAP
jgi:maleylacetoacetate isomerase